MLIQLSTFYLFLVTVYNFVFSFFTGNDPGWRCSNISTSSFCTQHYNINIFSDNDLFGRRCLLNRTEWEFLEHKDYSFVTGDLRFIYIPGGNFARNSQFFIKSTLTSICCFVKCIAYITQLFFTGNSIFARLSPRFYSNLVIKASHPRKIKN